MPIELYAGHRSIIDLFIAGMQDVDVSCFHCYDILLDKLCTAPRLMAKYVAYGERCCRALASVSSSCPASSYATEPNRAGMDQEFIHVERGSARKFTHSITYFGGVDPFTRTRFIDECQPSN